MNRQRLNVMVNCQENLQTNLYKMLSKIGKTLEKPKIY